jgi:hypothetical protein
MSAVQKNISFTKEYEDEKTSEYCTRRSQFWTVPVGGIGLR